jgi:hypothetical protein
MKKILNLCISTRERWRVVKPYFQRPCMLWALAKSEGKRKNILQGKQFRTNSLLIWWLLLLAEYFVVKKQYHILLYIFNNNGAHINISMRYNSWDFFSFFCSTGVWTQGLHLVPLHQPFFMIFFFEIGCSKPIFPGWLQTIVLLNSAPWVARITGVSYWCPENVSGLSSIIHPV